MITFNERVVCHILGRDKDVLKQSIVPTIILAIIWVFAYRKILGCILP